MTSFFDDRDGVALDAGAEVVPWIESAAKTEGANSECTAVEDQETSAFNDRDDAALSTTA